MPYLDSVDRHGSIGNVGGDLHQRDVRPKRIDADASVGPAGGQIGGRLGDVDAMGANGLGGAIQSFLGQANVELDLGAGNQPVRHR
ncbi:MAG TPA: hypothetical protein VH374_06385 [Polyangia bacterium]|nr:hypothetical protein [Polyangia bacterium]